MDLRKFVKESIKLWKSLDWDNINPRDNRYYKAILGVCYFKFNPTLNLAYARYYSEDGSAHFYTFEQGASSSTFKKAFNKYLIFFEENKNDNVYISDYFFTDFLAQIDAFAVRFLIYNGDFEKRQTFSYNLGNELLLSQSAYNVYSYFYSYNSNSYDETTRIDLIKQAYVILNKLRYKRITVTNFCDKWYSLKNKSKTFRFFEPYGINTTITGPEIRASQPSQILAESAKMRQETMDLLKQAQYNYPENKYDYWPGTTGHIVPYAHSEHLSKYRYEDDNYVSYYYTRIQMGATNVNINMPDGLVAPIYCIILDKRQPSFPKIIGIPDFPKYRKHNDYLLLKCDKKLSFSFDWENCHPYMSYITNGGTNSDGSYWFDYETEGVYDFGRLEVQSTFIVDTKISEVNLSAF